MDTLITSRTEGQEKQYKRFIEDAAGKAAGLALEKVNPDKDGIQRVFERGDELGSAISEVVVAKTQELSVGNQFADEEAESNYGYLSGYKKPKAITVQTNCLRELFSGIGYADEKLVEQELPEKAEGWFAIPRWEKFALSYQEAVKKVLEKIRETRKGKFCNYRQGQLGPEYLRQHSKTARMFQMIGNQQKNHDILVIPCQFGILHRGRSVRRAREVMKSTEFGLGAFAVGIMLLTHPERLQHYNDLWIDCAGDEYSSEPGGGFVLAPCFYFHDGWVEFGARWSDDAVASDGSASAFWQ